MDSHGDINERLREAVAMGAEDKVVDLLRQGADVNSRNKMNGWTALHWASKRGYTSTVRLLVNHGADPSIPNDKEQLPNQLTSKEEIHEILGKPLYVAHAENPPIIPNYIRNPPFPYSGSNGTTSNNHHRPLSPESIPDSRDLSIHELANQLEELVLKVRIAKIADTDFIEVELQRDELTMANLVRVCCEELEVSPEDVAKIRKLPNTIVRKDKDVQRLKNFQELELVVRKKSAAEAFHIQISNHNLVY